MILHAIDNVKIKLKHDNAWIKENQIEAKVKGNYPIKNGYIYSTLWRLSLIFGSYFNEHKESIFKDDLIIIPVSNHPKNKNIPEREVEMSIDDVIELEMTPSINLLLIMTHQTEIITETLDEKNHIKIPLKCFLRFGEHLNCIDKLGVANMELLFDEKQKQNGTMKQLK